MAYSFIRITGFLSRFFAGALMLYVCWIMIDTPALAQEAGQPKTIMGSNVADTLKSDTTKVIEDVPLDIAQNRGLFIVTPDQKMQLRILGSVRYLLVYDNTDLTAKNNFDTYEISTGSLNRRLPNYFNGLEQTRFGFEVTRKTDKGNIFIRLETDFAGTSGFRIRHAYGQYRRFLFGQTWSLFSQVGAHPAIVGSSGPTGSILVRTPQIRYTIPKFISGTRLTLGMEYGIPELDFPDSIQLKSFQLIPDITARVDKTFDWGSLQVSGILPVLSARDADEDVILRPGWGLALSAVINSWANGTWYLQGVTGQAITRFFNDLSGKGLDIIIDPDSGTSDAPISFGYYGTYEHYWRDNLFSNVSYGMVLLQQVSFTADSFYHWGHTFRLNTFYDIVEGARIGAEMIWGRRTDKDRQHGNAGRFNVLFYYDF